MKSSINLLIAVLLFARVGSAQVPAPDFDMWISNLQMTSFDLNVQVAGPPGSTFDVLFTLQNPFTTPIDQIALFPLDSGALGPSGQSTTTLSIPSWQGPLPDVWFGAIVYQPSGAVDIAGIVKLGGAMFGPAPGGFNQNAIVSLEYALGGPDWNIFVQTGLGGGTAVMWDVDCANAPAVGAAGFNGIAPPANFQSSVVIGPNGSCTLTGTVPQGRCIVITIAGVVIGVIQT